MRSVIVSAVRTPFGKLGGGLASKQATELGAIAIRAALERVDVEDGDVEYVIMGQVLQGGAGQAPARQAAIGAGLPIDVPADTINKVCASSIRAVEIADAMIRAGDHDVIVAGGMESMSNAPYASPKARFGYKLGDGKLVDLMVHDGLVSSFDGRHMVEQASFVSRELGITARIRTPGRCAHNSGRRRRSTRDASARRSSRRRGRYRRGAAPRHVAREARGAASPSSTRTGTTTAGNAPGVNDGAGALVVTSEEFARERGLDVLATIVGKAYVADEFAYLARTPAGAGNRVLERGRQEDR